MRIVSGTAKGRRLTPPPKSLRSIRPTSDRAREALFQILGLRVKDAVILDLFAGTGALGLEAFSRGAKQVIFVDSNHVALKIIAQNVRQCFPLAIKNVQSNTIILYKKDIRRGLSFLRNRIDKKKFNLIFIDPPYEKKLAVNTLAMVQKCDILENHGRIVVEEKSREHFPKQIGNFSLISQRKYGETGFWIYKNDQPLQRNENK